MIEIVEDDGDAERQVWASMPHRILSELAGPFLRAQRSQWFEKSLGSTISLAPRDYSDRLATTTTICPACGRDVRISEGWLARLHATFAGGSRLGYGVWVHPTCFWECPDADHPAPIPW